MIELTRIKDLSGSSILENGTMRLLPLMCFEAHTLFKRLNDNSYIVAFLTNTNFEENTCTWSNGYYIKDYVEALKEFFNRTGQLELKEKE